MKIKLQNGSKVDVYKAKHRNTMINSDNCKTEYVETVEGSGIYKVLE